VLAVCLALAGCATEEIAFGDALAYPGDCGRLVLDDATCAALVEDGLRQLALDVSDVERIELLTEDRCGDARESLCTRGIGFAAGVHVILRDGSSVWTNLTCPPTPAEAAKPYC
jgi:hypothetical protein